MASAPPEMPPPGGAQNPIDVEGESLPTYPEGSVPGAPLDLTEGEPDAICIICQDVRDEKGLLCNKVSLCCRVQTHQSCYSRWEEIQRRRYDSVSCPNCRIVGI